MHNTATFQKCEGDNAKSVEFVYIFSIIRLSQLLPFNPSSNLGTNVENRSSQTSSAVAKDASWVTTNGRKAKTTTPTKSKSKNAIQWRRIKSIKKHSSFVKHRIMNSSAFRYALLTRFNPHGGSWA
jgi:hypothetical protein